MSDPTFSIQCQICGESASGGSHANHGDHDAEQERALTLQVAGLEERVETALCYIDELTSEQERTRGAHTDITDDEIRDVYYIANRDNLADLQTLCEVALDADADRSHNMTEVAARQALVPHVMKRRALRAAARADPEPSDDAKAERAAIVRYILRTGIGKSARVLADEIGHGQHHACPGATCEDDDCAQHNSCRGCGNELPRDRKVCGALECGGGPLP